MSALTLNWWAILAAVVANFAIGGLWYSPALFVHPWMRMAGVDLKVFQAGFGRAIAVDVVSSIVIAMVLAVCLHVGGGHSLVSGLHAAFLLWLGFNATILIASVTYEHRPFAFFAINAGYRLVSMLAMAAILTLWK